MMSGQSQFDILDNKAIPINQEYIIELTKENINIIDHETKKKCKIIKFTSNFNFNEILLIISRLEPKCYPNLLIFIIEDKNFGFSCSNSFEKVKILHKFLSEFAKSRPLILQLTSNIEKDTKIYYKAENVEKFLNFVNKPEKSEAFTNFSSFLLFYFANNSNNFESDVLKILPRVKNSSIILRFLRCLKFSLNWSKLVEKCAAFGTKSELLAAIDAPLDDEVRGKELDPGNFLSMMSEPTLVSSVLHKAVQSPNLEIVYFLIKTCKDLIQQLPLDHQIEISTAALDNGQHKVLCDLVDLADFPFPNELNIELVTNERLRNIIKNRAKFHENILSTNLKKIEEFASENPKIKFAYNLENKSALCNALDSKKFESFFLLQALRYDDKYIGRYSNELENDDDKKVAGKFAADQRRQNVNIATNSKDNIIKLLLTRSFIYNRDPTDDLTKQHNEIIKKWFEEINKTSFGPDLLNAVSQCEDLKIIFDFECDSVKNVDVAQPSECLGTTHPISKFIFVGAKLSGEKIREQEIKGVLAHEICHYAMRLVYQNNDSPFYKEDHDGATKFDNIVAEIEKMFLPERPEQEQDADKYKQMEVDYEHAEKDENEQDVQKVDDECCGIISLVYKCYDKQDWIAELIVRPVHIQTQFDDNEEKLQELEQKYKSLFEFCEKFVMPELKKFNLSERKNAQSFNKLCGLLSDVRSQDLELSKLKVITDIMNDQLVVVTTNVPKLFLLNVLNYLNAKDEYFVDIHNIFVKPQALNNPYIYEKFQEILKNPVNLKIIIDCSKSCSLKILDTTHAFKAIFIVSNIKHCDELCKKLKEKGLSMKNETVNYGWMDLTAESQKNLLNTKVNFQNNPNFSLNELVADELDPQNVKLENLSVIFESQLLNKLIGKQDILINPQNNEKTFDILFRTRNLVKNDSTGTMEKKSHKISINHMLEDVKDQKFVLISDKAGSGKSWILKNFTHLLTKLYPKKWITYVDLKQYIGEFNATKINPEFSNFIAEKILKPKNKFESKIFEKLYKNGKICILFDGFDEIAPNYADFVSNLCQKFQQNGGNQLWIATRDYFEVSLQNELGINVVYKLDEFTEQHGIDLIATCWVLDDMKSKINCDLFKAVKSSPYLKEYKDRAAEISKKMSKLQTSSIGLPQFYKMIADILKDAKNSKIDFSMFKIFEECVNIQYRRWADEKGELRKKENIAIQHKDLNYHKLHELIAMKSLFPKQSKFSDLNYDQLVIQYIDEEIIACGMLIKIGENFFFPHETYREYYAAKYIIRNLIKDDDDSIKYLIEFLTIRKYDIIRIFMNEALKQKDVFDKIEKNMTKISEVFSANISAQKLSHIFVEGLKYLVDFLIKVFQSIKSYEQVVDILNKNADIMKSALEWKASYEKIHCFVVDYLKETDLKEFLSKTQIIKLIFTSKLISKDIKIAIKLIINKTESKFISDQLLKRHDNEDNFLFHLIRSQHEFSNKLEEKLENIENFLTIDQILKLAKERNNDGENILHVCVGTKNQKSLQVLWNKLEKLFTSQDSHDKFTELVYQKTTFNETIFHIAASCEKIEFHQTLWEVLLKTIEIQMKLEHLIMQKDKDGCHFIYFLKFNNTEIVKLTLEKIKNTLKIDPFRQIIFSIDFNGKNLLQKAAKEAKTVEIFQYLFIIFLNSSKSHQEFLRILNHVDSLNNNIFHYIASWSISEIFEFLINRLEELTTKEEIKKMLNSKNSHNQNLMQCAAGSNKSCELHKVLWKIVKKYFKYSEILKIILNIDTNGDNIFYIAIKNNPKNVLKLTCSEIKDVLSSNSELECSELLDYFIENPEKCLIDKLVEKLKITNFLRISMSEPNFMHTLACCDKIEYHEELWKNWLNKNEKLIEFIQQKDAAGRNFIHLLILKDNFKIIEFTFNKLKISLNDAQYQEVINIPGYENKSLLQAAACESKKIKTHQILWKIIQNSCKSNKKFFEILEKVNINNYNIFHLIACCSTSEIFEFAIRETEKIAGSAKVKSILFTLSFRNGSLLHAALNYNKSLELHKKIWEFIEKYLNSSDIINLINHCDYDGDNIFHQAVYWSKKDIVEFTWSKIEFFINTKNGQLEYLDRIGHCEHGLKEMSLENQSNDAEVNIYIKRLVGKVQLEYLNLNCK